MKINELKTKYEVKSTSMFNKNLKKIVKQGKNIDILKETVVKLANGEELDLIYNNHRLTDSKHYKDCWECHLGTTRSDWLLIYKIQDNELILLLYATGSHSELFNK